jgi:ketosteroid isomerase-like protein
MSRENVEIVELGFAAFDDGDVDRMRQLVTEDFVSHRAHPDGATYYGLDGFLALVGEWMEDFSEWSSTPKEYVDLGEHVVVRVHQAARGEGSGMLVEGDFWFVYEIRDARISRLSIYATKSEALKATESGE